MLSHRSNYFSYFCLIVYGVCLLIILWGAWVRISNSGTGCGHSWPSCRGEYLISLGARNKTWIEWIHRASSGVFGGLVCLLFFAGWKKFPKKHPIRKAVSIVLLFTISEALIGARLVLGGLTGDNTSIIRVLTMNIHLINSLLLTASLFITWRLSLGKSFSFFKDKNHVLFLKKIFIFIFFSLAFLGSISSLSSVLFPSPSLWQGLLWDFSSQVPWLIRWRWVHPVMALLLGGGFLYLFITYFLHTKRAQLFVICLSLTLFSGFINLLLLSPALLKITHLLMVYLLTAGFLLSLETHPQAARIDE